MIPMLMKLEQRIPYSLPLFASAVSAGFPSPAEDYLEGTIDLNEHLISRPAATYLVRAAGESMIDAGIHSGDLLIVDRSLEAADGDIVIAAVDGQFTVKRLRRQTGQLRLLAENPRHPPVNLDMANEVEIWGVVLHVIHSVRRHDRSR